MANKFQLESDTAAQTPNNMPQKPKAMRAAVRDSRAKQAKSFINISLPAILKSNARARRGVQAVELISNIKASTIEHPEEVYSQPEPVSELDPELSWSPAANIAVWVTDTLTAAAELGKSKPQSNLYPRIAVLNMASPLRPGGGVFTGATSQEEFLCSRTTLYASLDETFYRLPELGGIYTPDVLVCKSSDASAKDLPQSEQFYVDVVSAAMLRMPDVEVQGSQLVYAEDQDREIARNKMRAIMRILRHKGVGRVILGAWGCGAYGNPTGEIAKAWKTVLCGGGRAARRSSNIRKGSEFWPGLQVVFAIKDPKMAAVFADCLDVTIQSEMVPSDSEEIETEEDLDD